MNETIRTLHSLHTTHGHFSGEEVPDRDVEAILHACVCAASASARQSYSVIVVDDKAAMREYFDYTGSKALLFCVDFTRLTDTADYLQHPYACGGLQDFITGSTDTILAAQTAAVAAASLGRV
ncbi:MAG: nitroreductase [Paenibacillaceae bacterium]|jgi:nitroreductase|nr:nitroreductase [Paenibacillaceae bacterium]